MPNHHSLESMSITESLRAGHCIIFSNIGDRYGQRYAKKLVQKIAHKALNLAGIPKRAPCIPDQHEGQIMYCQLQENV